MQKFGFGGWKTSYNSYLGKDLCYRYIMSFLYDKWFIIFKNLFIYNWRIIALQGCIGFSQTSAWKWVNIGLPMSPPTWTSVPPPSHPHPSRLFPSPGCISWVIQKIPIGYLYFTYGNVCFHDKWLITVIGNKLNHIFPSDAVTQYHRLGT